MLHLLFRFFGFLFSWLAIGSIMALGALAAVFAIYGKDLPDTAQLERYEPPTLSRDLLRRGRADGRVRPRAADLHPDRRDPRPDQAGLHLRRGQELLRATTASTRAASPPRSTTRRSTASRLRGASTITQQVMKNFLLTGDRSGERKIKEIILATRLENTLSQGRDPRALPQRDLPRPELLRRHRRRAGLLRQVARRADAGRGRLSRGAAAGAERAAPGPREGRAPSPGATTSSTRWPRTATSPARRPRRPRPRTC